MGAEKVEARRWKRWRWKRWMGKSLWWKRWTGDGEDFEEDEVKR